MYRVHLHTTDERDGYTLHRTPAPHQAYYFFSTFFNFHNMLSDALEDPFRFLNFLIAQASIVLELPPLRLRQPHNVLLDGSLVYGGGWALWRVLCHLQR